MHISTKTLAAAALIFFGLSAVAKADPIVVNNPSFEIQPNGGLPYTCGTGCSYSGDAIPGWTGGSGQFQPGSSSGNFNYFNYVPDGLTVAYGGGVLYQTVTATIQAGQTYVFTVDLGSRNDTGFGSEAGLYIDGHFHAATGVVPTRGNWSTYTYTFDGTAARAGDSITIELLSTGAQGDYDNVTLSNFTSTPEPSSLALLGTGLVGLVGVGRRKFFKA